VVVEHMLLHDDDSERDPLFFDHGSLELGGVPQRP
jgi:hypothetical protein